MRREELYAHNRIIVIDGAMGTRLQAEGLPAGQIPEEWNLNHPDKVAAIHREYVAAGAMVMTTNTFGANRCKLAEYDLADRQEAIVTAAVKAARLAGDGVLVTGGVGPTGKLFAPMGDLTFADAIAVFRQQAELLVRAGVDLISIETMSDIAEARAALLAVRAVDPTIPVLVQLTFDATGRTLTGSTPQVVAAAFSSLRPLAVGTNCGLGPDGMRAIVSAYRVSGVAPVVALPNAGLPELEQGRTVFRMRPAEYASGAVRLVEAGAIFIGGCCGTTPDHIQAVVAACRDATVPAPPQPLTGTMLASRRRAVLFGTGQPFAVIGERVNPTGRNDFLAELGAGRTALARREAKRQAAAGAAILDINVGGSGVDEVVMLPAAAAAVQDAADLPVSLDTSNREALLAALGAVAGKPLLNSVSGEADKLEHWLPLAKEYGAAAVVLALEGKALPQTVEERLAAVAKVVAAADELGIPRCDLVIDVLTLTVSARPTSPLQTCAALREVKRRWPDVATVLGVSNVSFGLPRRDELNAAFLAMAVASGLDAGIINPLARETMISLAAAEVLSGRDAGARRYIGGSAAVGSGKAWSGPAQAVLEGDAAALPGLLQARMTQGAEPLQLINEELIPAITEVGERYNRGDYFLPQLMMAAEAMQCGFKFLRPRLAKADLPRRGTVVLATVKNDIHDIGKNIVRVMCANSGYRVIDLGKDVAADEIVTVVETEEVSAIGLSALMTTTMVEMPRVIAALRQRGLTVPVMVGGAVVTRAYAEEIGGHYAADAVGAVKLLEKLCGGTDVVKRGT